MKPGTHIRFHEHGQTKEGYVVGPRCEQHIYIMPIDWPEEDFPHVVYQNDIVILEEK